MHGHQVEQPWRVLFARTRPARTQNRLLLAQNLGLNEEVAEGGMQRVGRVLNK
jgi:hypothetical protein